MKSKFPKENYWFKAKNYGWGWYPATWQGWAVLVIFVLYFFSNLQALESTARSGDDILLSFGPSAFIAITILLCICYLTGETPQWRWGGRPLKKKLKPKK